MKVPTESEYHITKRKRRINFGCGFFVGLIFFGLIGLRLLRYGISEINFYTWLALAFGVLSFSFLAARFGEDFWNIVIGNH